jgi:glycosyltransferase involved in cell wall biosynthesis
MGGAENITLSIIRNDKKYEHVIVVLKGHTNFQKYCQQKYKIRFINLDFKTNSFFSFSNWKSLFSLVIKFRPSIIQSYMYDASKYARFIGLFFKVPVVIYIVNTYSQKKFKRGIVNYLLSFLTKKIIVNSREVERDVIRYDKISEKKIILVPSFANLDFKKDASLNLRKKFKIKKTDYLFLFIARLVEQKGLDCLIDSFAICIHEKNIKNLKLVVVGDGPIKGNLLSQIEHLKLKKHVFLAGEAKNLNPYLTEANAYVDSSIRSGLSVAAIKAMEAALPLIMTDVGGARQLTNNGKYGDLCPPNDAISLSSLLSSYALNKTTRKLDSTNYVRKHFSDIVVTKKILNIYSKIIQK